MKHKLRPTIGYLTDVLFEPYQNELFHAVLDVARERDANLITFVIEPAWIERGPAGLRNPLLELVGPENVDGVVLQGGPVVRRGSADTVSVVCNSLRQLPWTCATIEIEGVPSVVEEYEQGMRGLVAHLIEAHGCHRIAFIRDLAGQKPGEARYQSYLRTLAEHGIPFDPDLVVWNQHWDLEGARRNISILLDERRVRPDAIVAITDRLAIWIIEALRERGMRVPQDVAVVGYDDIEAARFVTPPLTTVHQPIGEQTRTAAEMLLDMLAGRPVAARVVLPTALVLRRSCGCPSQAVTQAAVGAPYSELQGSLQDALSAQRQVLYAAIAQTVPDKFAGQAARLLDTLVAELGGARGVFLDALDEILRQVADSGDDVAVWQDAVSTLRRGVLPHLGEQARAAAEDLWTQARVMIGEVMEQVQGYRRHRQDYQLQVLTWLGEVLGASLDMEHLARALAEQLPLLGIPRGCISLYENPDAPAGWVHLLLAYNEGQIIREAQRFPARQLSPAGLWQADRRRSAVVVPLHFREEHFGFGVFEMGPREGVVYESLRLHIGGALKSIRLYNDALEARTAAERADQLKTRLLANVTHELRTPLNVILGYTRTALDVPGAYGIELPPDLRRDLGYIHQSAEHQLRIINDLLDLSRAEIGELDLYPEWLDPRTLLEDAFRSIAASIPTGGPVAWRLELPERLPVIQADPVRLRQVVLNLLSNAGKFTERGEIVLGAEVAPPYLHIWVRDTGVGIPPDQRERIFEPFVKTVQAGRRLEGIGLGLSITRRLVALHHGLMRLESEPGRGSTFHVYLPLPSLSDRPAALPATAQALLLLSAQQQPAAEILEFSHRQGLEIHPVRAGDDLEALLAEIQPVALAWDLTGASAGPDDWALVQRVRKHPRLSQLPFILYGHEPATPPAAPVGVTSVVVKPVGGEALAEAIGRLRPVGAAGPILIVDDDPATRERYRILIERKLPGYPVRVAENGATALAVMTQETPSLVVLDLMMPGMDGFEVLDWMRAEPRTRGVPVLILSNRQLTLEDVRRLERHARVTLQSKGILSDDEIATALHQSLFGKALPAQTGALVKRTLAYFHQHYAQPLSRAEIARAIGVNGNYLSEIFRQELGLSPWEYLNRYRIKKAKDLLDHTDKSVTAIAFEVGFNDPAYFNRVFRKIVGMSPGQYRKFS